jgi:hypothetical protein
MSLRDVDGTTLRAAKKNIVRSIKSIHDIILEFIIINSLPCSGQLRRKTFHLGDILLSCHVQFLGVNEGTSNVGNPRLGLGGEKLMDSTPNFSSMNHTIDMREDIVRQRINNVAHNLLIPCDPGIIGRVGELNLFLVSILRINKLRRRQIRTFKHAHNSGATEVGQNLSSWWQGAPIVGTPPDEEEDAI